MHKSKFSLADLLTVLGAALFGFFCFLSLNYYTFGQTLRSIMGAVVIALIVGGLAFIVKLLKTTNGNFRSRIIWEWVFLVLFAVVAFVAVIPFSQYFFVLDQKDEIQSKVSANITQAEGMFTKYEDYSTNRESFYKRRLQSIVSAKKVNQSLYRKLGFGNNISDAEQIDNKMFTLHAKLFPSNYEGKDGTKQVATSWLDNAKNTLESKWAFTFGIVTVIKCSQTNITNWKGELIKNASFRAQGETANDFEFPLTFTDVTDKFTKLYFSPATNSTVYAIILYVVMLTPYFVSKRSTKNHYSLFRFTTGYKSKKESPVDIEY
jgi:hypothetical protein